MNTWKRFCSVNFFFFLCPTHNTSRGFLYYLGGKILNSTGKFLTLGKSLNSCEKYQLLRKFLTQKTSTNSKENYQLWRKILVKDKTKNNSHKWNCLLTNICSSKFPSPQNFNYLGSTKKKIDFLCKNNLDSLKIIFKITRS